MKRTSKIVDGKPVITLTFTDLDEFTRYQESSRLPRAKVSRGTRTPISPKVRESVRRMHKAGTPYRVIQAKHHISKTSIGRILRAKGTT